MPIRAAAFINVQDEAALLQAGQPGAYIIRVVGAHPPHDLLSGLPPVFAQDG